MREIDEKALQAQLDNSYLEKFIIDYENFILSAAHKGSGRFVTKRDDQWSVALSAFHEAVRSYEFEKGAFLPFAETVIRRRLYDYSRKESRHDCEILIDSYSLEQDADDPDAAVKHEIMVKTASFQESGVKLEIEMISEVLSKYDITFLELTGVSPKARKTKIACGAAIRYLIQNPLLINEMRTKRTLPLKIIEKNQKLPRKVLERHRKYIIAGAEILAGDYPVLSDYLKFVREEETK